MAAGALQRAGLVTTNSIRGGANRKVLDAICAHTRIFEAWSDEPWINNGAAVRVSLVCFGAGDGTHLNGADVPQIYADLTAPATAGDSLNLGLAKGAVHQLGLTSFQGASKKAKFEIDATLAREWICASPIPTGARTTMCSSPGPTGLN